MVHKPSWFRDGEVFVSFADTVGINKDGNTLFAIDSTTGKRTATVDDKVAADVEALLGERTGATSRWIPNDDFSLAVPSYYNDRHTAELSDLLRKPGYDGFEVRSLGSLIEDKLILARPGHGSPSADVRDGTFPYIKVSDIRAGQVNINPTNMVPLVVAERFWRGESSGLRPFDLITPVRASKNIGDFAMLMPGQQDIVVTKEVLILRAADLAPADNFFLMWALSLNSVRSQWDRVVFMQTNREDVGRRYLEINIPWPTDSKAAGRVSKAFRDYYQGIEKLRTEFTRELARDGIHHVYLGVVDDD